MMVGDIVIPIDVYGAERFLRKDKEYIVREILPGGVYCRLVGIDYHQIYFYRSRFRIIGKGGYL